MGSGGGGITYAGDVVQNAPAGDDATRSIEIPFEDENFLVKATSKNPPSIYDSIRSTLGNLAEGAYSWPFDYTLCIHWIAGRAGLYGPRVKRNCDYHMDRVLTVLGAGRTVIYYLIFRGILWKIATNETTQSMIGDALGPEGRNRLSEELQRQIPNIAGAAEKSMGRYASGMFFSRWMESRVKGRGGGKTELRVLGGLNFVMLLWGSAIHTSIKHPGDLGLIEIFVGWINGDSEYQVPAELYAEIFRTAQSMSEMLSPEALGEDYDLYREVIDQVTEFGRRGGRSQ